MSSKDIAVSVRGLSKSYAIARNQQRHTTAGEALLNKLRNPFQRAETDTFWALKDVSFDVKKGDVVGIIGRNGAGKSTLLKILSQITEPTAGEIRLYGRVGSLLEVGTGFHPELTGRENIFLNGAILGMRKSEIQREFDAIVDFAEVDQFLDTPVKRYSSGMYVRLAFAVAAHLNPEILIVDEVLAVGDAAFQKKCLGKMQDVAREQGRTVLFVSHNMNAVEQLCSSALLLKNGRVADGGHQVRDVVRGYLLTGETDSTTRWRNEDRQLENPYFKPLEFFVADEHGYEMTTPVRSNAGCQIRVQAEAQAIDPSLNVGYALYSEDGQVVYWSVQTDTKQRSGPSSASGATC